MKNKAPRKSTPLKNFPSIGEKFNVKGVFVKDESVNKFGTIKDRRSEFIVREANRLKIDKLVLITAGNNGYSLSQMVKGTPIKVVCIVSRNASPAIKKALHSVAYQVIELNLEHKILRPEEIITFAREREDEVIWDVTNGYEDSYASVVEEILDRVTPSHLVVPIGSGGLYVGFIQAVDQKGIPSKVIGVGVQNINYSLADKLYTPWTPYAKALEHYQTLGHIIYRLTEDEVRETYERFKNLVECEPSSSTVFAALNKHSFLPDNVVVFVNSGKSNITGANKIT